MAKAALEKVRVRIAPSPTGPLHLGNARTALFNELFARKQGGSFIVRMEDTDKARSKQEFEENILEAFKWLGLSWDEGPDIGGPYGPYRQSERTDLYTQALEKLLVEEKAYFCGCKPEEKGRVCNCLASQVKILAEGERSRLAVRLKVASDKIAFDDLIRGRVEVTAESFGGDFIIARAITNPLFHLAVVVDDAAMQISHVIRGEDHISNTPKHILLQRALGYSTPIYAHVPLLLDTQRRKLSKRMMEVSLLYYRDEKGILPQTMINYLALLGWNPKTDQEFFSHDELRQIFSLDGIHKGGAIFDIKKLEAMNRSYVSQLDSEELFKWGKRYFEEGQSKERFIGALKAEQGRISSFGDELAASLAWGRSDWKTPDNFLTVLSRKNKYSNDLLADRLKKLIDFLNKIPRKDFTAVSLEEKLLAWIDKKELGRAESLWPMRVALAGREHSPGPFEVAAVLGKEDTLNRLEQALTIVKKA